MNWSDLTEEQQCVLFNAIEDSYLGDVLAECTSGPNWPDDRFGQLPHLVEVIEDLMDQGLVAMNRDAPARTEAELDQPPVDVPADQVHEVLADRSNWWNPDSSLVYALTATDKGRAVYRGQTVLTRR